MKPGSAFSVTDDTPAATALTAIWKDVYTKILQRADDVVRRKYKLPLNVTRPAPAPGSAFSVSPKKVDDNGKK